MMKYRIIFFWLFCFALLFVYLQTGNKYFYYYIEQNQLFLNSWPYLEERLAIPGGGALVLSEFLVQFFAYPYLGAFISAFLLTCTGIGTESILRKISLRTAAWPLLSLLPPLSLLLVQFDFNYFTQGTVAYLLLLGALRGYFFLKSPAGQFAYTLLLALALFWLAGPVALLFTIAIGLLHIRKQPLKGCWYLLPPAIVLAGGVACIYLGFWNDYRMVFLPDLYYHHQLKPKSVIYFSWITLLLVLLTALFLGEKGKEGKKRLIIQYALQVALLAVLCYYGIEKYSNRKSSKFMRFDYYVRTGQWDTILRESGGKQSNYLYPAILNLALAEKGELADRIFSFDQLGMNGLFPSWNKSTNISILLSDLFFAMGNIVNAQEMAFEAYISAPGYGNPRMLKRLIQTNLIYGFWPVAEKYIGLLEQTVYYRDWAKSQRRFLYNDAEVEKDPLLGSKRKCLPEEGRSILTVPENLDLTLAKVAEANPSNRTAIEYLGSICLMSKELKAFQELLDRYYGTEVLPQLPRSFQEAVIILSEAEPGIWQKYKLDHQIIRRFTEYKKQVLAMKNNPSAPGLLYRSFGDTYWFYFMYK